MFDTVFGPLQSAYQSAYDTVYDNIVAPYAEPSRDKLLPDRDPRLKSSRKPTLVISLDGTLIESQWTRQFGWRYAKRPGVDDFLTALAPLYEIVLWTDCLSSADVVIDKLDQRRLIQHRLYRDATTYTGGMHRKDLSALNRDIDNVVIIDCDERCFSLQPANGIAVKPYSAEKDPNKQDAHLKRLIPFLAFFAIGKTVNSVGTMAEELAALKVATKIEDNGEAFEKATQERFKELRDKGLMPVQKGGRIIPGRNAKAGAAQGGGNNQTIWSRMGIGGR